MSEIVFGREITSITIRDGVPVGQVRTVEESTIVRTRQELFDQILAQLDNLKEFDCIRFEVYADKSTREPNRIVNVREMRLT